MHLMLHGLSITHLIPVKPRIEREKAHYAYHCDLTPASLPQRPKNSSSMAHEHVILNAPVYNIGYTYIQ